jgi:P-type Na+/K+ transporter
LKTEWTEMAEFPFDSAVKRMSVIYDHKTFGRWVFLKGAVERVLDVCTKYGNRALDDWGKGEILRQMETFASQGLVPNIFNFS